MVVAPALLGIGAMMFLVAGAMEDEALEPKVKFALPFIAGVWIVCTLWAYWPMIMR